MSRSIKRLEDTLQCTLFNRTTRNIDLTEEGARFATQIRQGLKAIEEAELALKYSKEQPSGKLRVDAASPFIIHQLTPHIPAFQKAFPEISLDITSHEGIINLIGQRTDLAIRIGPLKDSNLHARMLGKSRLHLVATPEYLANAPKLNSVDDLSHHQLIGFTDSPHLNRWPLTKELKLNFHLRANNGETIRQLCLAHQGIALLSHFMIHQELANGTFVSTLSDQVISPNPREQVQAVFYKNSAVSSRITAFLEFIQPRLIL